MQRTRCGRGCVFAFGTRYVDGSFCMCSFTFFLRGMKIWSWKIWKIQKSVDELEDGDFRKDVPKWVLLSYRLRQWFLDLSLSNRYRDNFPNILKLVDGLQKLGKKHNATAGQVALAWLLAQGEDIIPIPGTKGIKVSFGHSYCFRKNTDGMGTTL